MSKRGEQLGEQGGNQNNISMVMFVQLQQEFEALKKNNEEELSILRAENAYMRRRLNEEIVLKTSFETVQPRACIQQSVYNEESFEVTRWKLSETSGTFAGTTVRRHLFSEAIIETSLPETWRNLTTDKYDGSSDPDEHITIYTTQISMYTWNDAILCM